MLNILYEEFKKRKLEKEDYIDCLEVGDPVYYWENYDNDYFFENNLISE